MANVKGTYALVLALDQETNIAVGRLGTFSFPSGHYLYVGSALGGLFPRVRRHVRGGRKIHWHIDYLRQRSRLAEVWCLISDERRECSWYRAATKMPHARMPVAGFGSSGCGCNSHLVYFASMPSLEAFRRKLGETGRALRKMSLEVEVLA